MKILVFQVLYGFRWRVEVDNHIYECADMADTYQESISDVSIWLETVYVEIRNNSGER